jgi:hypothetical protein
LQGGPSGPRSCRIAPHNNNCRTGTAKTFSPRCKHTACVRIYRYEIRRLRERLLRGEFPKNTYYDRVVTLRNKYSVLALKPFQFLE